jgi:putative hemolysin
MKQLLLVMIVAFGAVLIVACGAGPTPAAPGTEPPTDDTMDAMESPLDMPNPASRYCREQGYQLELRTDASGTTGYCVFPDGSECEEWAFYRGECGPADTADESPLGLPNPASAYCEEQGYELEMRTDASGTVGYCIFPDGTECEEWAFYRGDCAPGTPQP